MPEGLVMTMTAYFLPIDDCWKLRAGRNPCAGVALAGRAEWPTLEELDATLARHSMRRLKPRGERTEFLVVDL